MLHANGQSLLAVVVLLVKATLVVLDHVDEVGQSLLLSHGNRPEMSGHHLMDRRTERMVKRLKNE